jgi:hypothetical protein
MATPVNATPAGPSLLLIELGLALITIAVAFCWPRTGSAFFSKLEDLFGQLARKRALSVAIVGMSACMLRLLILPLSPIPKPFVHDDFSFILAADTFASGHLTNPTHPMWVHFESFHITHKPTYMSMYFPAQGMVLAAGKLIAGHPWWGVWASVGLMCAAICWMLQGWLPPRWAFFGGVLAVLRLALFSYWIDTYTGGAVAAIGGALVLGALPRIWHGFRARDFFWMAFGMALLANSRPYEGMLVCTLAVVGLCGWLIKKPHPPAPVLVKRIAPAATLLLATVAFMAYYNHRVFGNVFTPPYAVNRATYASAPHFLWQSPRPEPVYRHKVMRDFYSGEELKWFQESRTPIGLLTQGAMKLAWGGLFYLGFALAAPVIMLPWALRDRRIRFLVVTGIVFAAGLAIETWFIPHYAAPFTAVLYAILLQCMRHLRVWRPGGRRSGLFIVRAMPAVCLALATLCLYAQPLKIGLAPETWPLQAWSGTQPLGLRRATVLAELEARPEHQLAIVRYSSSHKVFEDWVYNAADIDGSKIVWAREMDPANNRELLRYFKDRKVWLVEPDSNPPRISPYPIDAGAQPQQLTVGPPMLAASRLSNRLQQLSPAVRNKEQMHQ